jgi:hypothetical protein
MEGMFMPIYRARVAADLVYKASKPLPAPNLVTIGNRVQTYLKVAATEGFEKKMEVLHTEDYQNVHVHHHDARYERCRPDYLAAHDHLGPIE